MTEYRDALSSLHTTLVDSRNGYEVGAEGRGENLVSLRCSRKWWPSGSRLPLNWNRCSSKLARRFDDDGSFMSTVHRTIISFQSMLTDLDETVLPGFIDGEKWIVGYYDEAISTAPEPDREVLLRQRADLSDRIEEMERRRSKAA